MASDISGHEEHVLEYRMKLADDSECFLGAKEAKENRNLV